MSDRTPHGALAAHLLLIAAGLVVRSRVVSLGRGSAPADALATAVVIVCSALAGIAALMIVAALVRSALRQDERRSAVEHDELVAGVVQGHRTVVGGDDDVLQPHAVLAGDVDARLDRVGVAGA